MTSHDPNLHDPASATAPTPAAVRPTDPPPGAVRMGPEAPGRPARRFPAVVRLVLATAAMFASIYSTAILAVVPVFRGDALETASNGVFAAASLTSFTIVLLASLVLVWLLMRFVDRRPWRHTGIVWHRRAPLHLLGGVALTAALVVPTTLLLDALGLLRPLEGDAIWDGQPVWLVLAIALGMAFLLQGIPEEVIWRGYVFQTLRTRPVVTVYISAIAFSLLHLSSEGGQQAWWEHIVYLAIPFGFSLLAGALVLRTGSWWWAPGVHGGFHVSNLITQYGLGLGWGPVMWAGTGAVLAIVGAVLLHTADATRSSATAPRADRRARGEWTP